MPEFNAATSDGLTQPSAEGSNEPRVRPRALVDALVERGIVAGNDLITLLGEARHHLTVAELERAVTRESLLSDSALAELKSDVSGYPHLEAGQTTGVPAIDASISRSTGAVVLSQNPNRVAMVEDLPDGVRQVQQALGGPFELVVCTVAQFIELHRAVYEGHVVVERRQLRDIYDVFDEAMRQRASDIHLSVGMPPMLRVDGTLVPLDTEVVDQEWMRREIGRIAGAQRLLRVEKEWNVDMAFPYGSSRFRLNFGSEKRGFTMAGRKIPSKIPAPDEIGLPLAAQGLVNLDRGLVLVTGPTGSGKSTTLAALLSTVAMQHTKHMITLEDPIEFLLPQGRGVTHQRELGVSFTSFADGLRQALRQDPDVILVGEMRDEETIRTALNAAETGHLVFGTLHTYDSASTVARIVSAFPAEEHEQIRGMLSYILKATIAQTLLRTANGVGRVAAYEVMLVNAAIANNLRKADGMAQLRQTIETGSREGMQTMDMALADLVRRRRVLEEHALEKVVDPDDFHRRLQG